MLVALLLSNSASRGGSSLRARMGMGMGLRDLTTNMSFAWLTHFWVTDMVGITEVLPSICWCRAE